MFDSPASAASDSHHSTGYFCAACKRQHAGEAFGSVGLSLDYCEPAITSLLASGVIVKDSQPAAGSRHYSLKREPLLRRES